MDETMSFATLRAFGQRRPGEALQPIELPAPGELGPNEVEIEVAYCSVCHSDVHLVDGDWGDVVRPLVPGHEVVGRVVGRGGDVRLEAGVLVGLGWQAGACGTCAILREIRQDRNSGTSRVGVPARSLRSRRIHATKRRMVAR